MCVENRSRSQCGHRHERLTAAAAAAGGGTDAVVAMVIIQLLRAAVVRLRSPTSRDDVQSA